MYSIISNFHILRPKYEMTQSYSLKWISKAHAYSKFINNKLLTQQKLLPELNSDMENNLNRYACQPGKIETRGTSLIDYFHQDWDQMHFFNLKNGKKPLMQDKMKLYTEIVDDIFAKFYSDIENAPSHLIHVTCTGYSSPSPAQELISIKGWGDKTTVTHAYHMGCYASLPALRIGNGFLLQDKAFSKQNNKDFKINRIDIVHTEPCTIHFNPSLHDPSQIVVQSLFADGFISYSLYDESSFNKSKYKNGLKILISYEEILSTSLDGMTWDLFDYGFKMNLSSKIPKIIAENIKVFINKMTTKSGLCFNKIKDKSIFAIHPGGPKIIQFIKKILELPDKSVFYSEEVLKKFGNMSSATLPHVWESILNSEPQEGTYVFSLAFGPGLTISGAIMSIV